MTEKPNYGKMEQWVRKLEKAEAERKRAEEKFYSLSPVSNHLWFGRRHVTLTEIMDRSEIQWKVFLFLLILIFVWGCHSVQPARVNPILGPQSMQGRGEQWILVVAVRFPDAEPTHLLEWTRKRIVDGLTTYVEEQSYGLTRVKADFRGWYTLPESLSKYKVSPYNFKVDRGRVRKLIQDTMTAVEDQVDFTTYHHMLIIPGVFTRPAVGYGMPCYCANPGMLTGVRRDYHPRFAVLKSKGGQVFDGGIFVGTDNAHMGHFAHDFLHALGGIYKNRRLVP